MRLLAPILIALALASTAGAAAAAKPSLRITPAETSIAITGNGFKSGEKVRVLVFHSGIRVSRAATATATGAFRLRIPVGAVDTCSFSYVSATGDRGSRATVRHVPAPCGPPLAP